MAHDTIEIYVRDLSEEDATDWLQEVFEDVEQVRDAPIVTYEGQSEGKTIPVQITEHVQNGPYTSLWFNAPDLPWDSASDCARAAHHGLGGEVLCYPNQSEEPWTLLQIVEGEETRVDERDLEGL